MPANACMCVHVYLFLYERRMSCNVRMDYLMAAYATGSLLHGCLCYRCIFVYNFICECPMFMCISISVSVFASAFLCVCKFKVIWTYKVTCTFKQIHKHVQSIMYMYMYMCHTHMLKCHVLTRIPLPSDGSRVIRATCEHLHHLQTSH